MEKKAKEVTTIPLPTSLAGTSVKVKNGAGTEHLAPLFFVSSCQVNYQIPPATAEGIATVTVTSGDGAVSIGTVTIAPVAPSLFTANSGGTGVVVGIAVQGKLDGSQTSELIANPDGTSRPIDLGPPGEIVVLPVWHRHSQP